MGQFDIGPYLKYEAFEKLKDIAEFMKIKNGGYFVEWECGADLSADTIKAKMLSPTLANGCLRAEFDFQSHAVQTSVIDEAKATVFSHLQRSDCSIKKAAS